MWLSRPSLREWRSALRPVLLAAAVAWLLAVVCWPWAHANPGLRPFQALAMIADFPFAITTLFEGRVYDSADVPWYYAPKWLLISLPEFLLLAAAITFTRLVRSLARGGLADRDRRTLSVAAAVGFPVAWVVVTGAPLYNGIRHLLFVVPPLCALSAVAVDHLLGRPDRLSRLCLAVIAVSAALTFVDLVRLHPHQVVYFNRMLAGGLASASARYDTDYFANSHRAGVDWLARTAGPGASVQCAVPALTVGTLLTHQPIPWRADYVLAGVNPDGRLETPGERVHQVTAAGVPILNVIRVDPAWQGAPVYHGPDAEFHYVGLAGAHALVGNVGESDRLYRMALDRRPDRAIWHYKLGRVLLDADRFEGAIAAFERAVALTPTYRAHFHLASCYHRLERYREAVDHYRRAIDLRFDSEWAWLNLGASLAGVDAHDEAAAAYREALRISPGLVDARIRLAELYAKHASHREAVEELDRIPAEEMTAVACRMKATSLRETGDLDGAREAVVRSVELDADGTDAWREHITVATALHAAGETAEAEEMYRAYLERHPAAAGAWQNLAILLYASDRFESARDAFANAVEADPTSVEALLGFAQAAERTDWSEEAMEAYRRVLALDSTNAVASERLEALVDPN